MTNAKNADNKAAIHAPNSDQVLEFTTWGELPEWAVDELETFSHVYLEADSEGHVWLVDPAYEERRDTGLEIKPINLAKVG